VASVAAARAKGDRHDRTGGPTDPSGAPDVGAAAALALRSALGHFATGVTIVTAALDGRPATGLAVSSFNAVSLDPPLVLWSLRRASRSLPVLREAGGFVVNVLGDHQHDLIARFAGGPHDRFDGLDWAPGRHGGPVIRGAIAHFECALHAEHDGGDHVILIGRVLAHAAEDGRPLVYWRGRPHGDVAARA
jgi:flavin reductase (DIM6/NTAB) family NADH-FMN oxidoreductase RutF